MYKQFCYGFYIAAPSTIPCTYCVNFCQMNKYGTTEMPFPGRKESFVARMSCSQFLLSLETLWLHNGQKVLSQTWSQQVLQGIARVSGFFFEAGINQVWQRNIFSPTDIRGCVFCWCFNYGFLVCISVREQVWVIQSPVSDFIIYASH